MQCEPIVQYNDQNMESSLDFNTWGHIVLLREDPQSLNGSLRYVDFILTELMSWILIFVKHSM